MQRKKEDEVQMPRGQPNPSDKTEMIIIIIIIKALLVTINAYWIF